MQDSNGLRKRSRNCYMSCVKHGKCTLCCIYDQDLCQYIVPKKKIDDWSQDEFLVSSVDPLEHEAVYIEQYSQGNIAFPYVVINHDH